MFRELFERTTGAAQIVKHTLSEQLLSSLSDKSFLIPESAIASYVDMKLESGSVDFQHVHCSADGIEISVSKKKLGASLKYRILLCITSFEISPGKNKASMLVKSDELTGSRMWDKIIGLIIRVIINDIISYSVAHSEDEFDIEYDKESRTATVDLLDFPNIEKLYEEHIILCSKRVIDFIQIMSISHEAEGLRVHFTATCGF